MTEQEIITFDIGRYRGEDGPGIRTIMFFKGCPLRCKWCSNPFGFTSRPQLIFNRVKCGACGACAPVCAKACNTVEDGVLSVDFERCTACGDCVPVCRPGARNISGKMIGVNEAYKAVMDDAAFFRRTHGGVTLSGGEVLMQHKAAAKLLQMVNGSLFTTAAIETSAHAPWEHLKSVAEHCDVVFVDLKLWDSSKHREYTGVDNDIILENTEKLCALSEERNHLKIVIRRPVLKGINDDEETTVNIAKFVRGLRGCPSVNLLPYHNLGESKYDMIGLKYELQNQEKMKTEEIDAVAKLTQKYAPNNRISVGGGDI
jgi:pyruvate formate lyase activating enzyme